MVCTDLKSKNKLFSMLEVPVHIMGTTVAAINQLFIRAIHVLETSPGNDKLHTNCVVGVSQKTNHVLSLF
jgi:hypothetical protein